MTLIDFMKMLQEAAKYTQIEPEVRQKYEEEGLVYTTLWKNAGLSCQLNLTADGNVSQEPTTITVSFTVPGSIA